MSSKMKWLITEYGDLMVKYECPACGYEYHASYYYILENLYNYCPNCGTKMHGGEEKEIEG